MNNTATLTAKPAQVKNKSKTSSKKKSLIISRQALLKIGIVLLVVALLGIGGFSYANAYDGKIYPKVSIAGVNVGGMTVSEAKNTLDKKVNELNSQGPQITYNDQTLTPKLDEMGVTFNIDQAITQAYQFGRKGNWKDRIVENYKILTHQNKIDIATTFDQEKFDNYLGQLEKVAVKDPVNASLAIHNGQITVSQPENGRGLDKEKLKNDLKEFINSGKNGEVSMVTSDLEPQILENGIRNAQAQAEIYMSAAPITVNFENSGWTADRAEIGSWITFSESGTELTASINPNTFIGWIEKQVAIPVEDREIEEGTGNILKEGQDGREVDTNTLTAQIREALNSGKPITLALVISAVPRGQKTVNPHAEAGRFAGRYIDINLSEQTVYAFEGSSLMNQFLISSGKRGYETPIGEYSVWGKTASQLMDGPDYYLPNVPWISWFNGEISIHGTYWHSNFGTPMSHGCINASIPDAEWVYSFVDIGTPVYVHY